jgi:hypothetical protein
MIELLPKSPTKNSIEQMILAEDCVHRMSYKLAKAPGTNREIADAVIAGCRNVIIGEADLKVEEAKSREATGTEEREIFSLLRPRYYDQALFNVTSARAGKCKIP